MQRFRIKSKSADKLSRRQMARVAVSAFQGIRYCPSLQEALKMQEDGIVLPDSLIERIVNDAEEAYQALHDVYPKLPRKRKKEFKRKLAVRNNTYIIAQAIILGDEWVKRQSSENT